MSRVEYDYCEETCMDDVRGGEEGVLDVVEDGLEETGGDGRKDQQAQCHEISQYSAQFPRLSHAPFGRERR